MTLSTRSLLPAALLALGVLTTEPAQAFAEDVCWAWAGGDSSSQRLKPNPFNCWDVQCLDPKHQHASSAGCVAGGILTYYEAAINKDLHARNTLHYDVVWLAARILGMSADDANILAGNSEATDLSTYQAFTWQGLPSTTASANVTVNLQGVTRLNNPTFGFWLHFVPWYAAPNAQAKTHLEYTSRANPLDSPFGATEVPLSHLRAWAFGKRATVCEFGLTTQPDVDTAPCAYESGGTTPLKLFVPIVAGKGPAEQTVQVTWQAIHNELGDACPPEGQSEHDACYKESWAAGAKGSLTALGIYVHAMGDRLSHFACTDSSAIQPPTAEQPGVYTLNYSNSCGQVAHILLHYPETAHAPLPSRSRDTVNFTLKEINAWLDAKTDYPRQTVKPRPGYPQAKDFDKLTALMVPALQLSNAGERLGALCKIAVKGYGIAWFDGNKTCRYPK